MTKLKQSPIILYLLVTLSPLGIDLHLPALVQLKEYFHINSALAQLSILFFVFSMGVGQLLFGVLSERLGKRNIGHLGAWLFIVGSAGILLTDNYSLVLFLRVLQGLGASALSVIAYATVNENYEKDEAAVIFSIQSGFLNVIPALAPIIGALLLTLYGWSLIFIFFTLYGIVILWQFQRHFHYKDIRQTAHYGTALKAIAKDKHFLLFSVVCVFGLGFIMTYLNIAPLLMMETFHTSTLEFSVYFAINAAVISAMSFGLKWFIEKLGALKCVFIGLGLIILGSLGLALLPSSIATFWANIIIASLGFAFAFGPSISFALANHQAYSGLASGILGFLYLSLSPVLAFVILSVGGLNLSVFGGVFALIGVVLLFALYQQRPSY